jgi:hypothetical protein
MGLISCIIPDYTDLICKLLKKPFKTYPSPNQVPHKGGSSPPDNQAVLLGDFLCKPSLDQLPNRTNLENSAY